MAKTVIIDKLEKRRKMFEDYLRQVKAAVKKQATKNGAK